ncbi:MAG TPA: SRPBCC family protein [Mycobacteriales bacterium]|nr:SRPBCC family protein [Mycobacteriales bacterium]
MNLENEFTVPVPVDEAWQVLLDVERVAPCMPGATLTSVDGDEFTGTVKVKVGPITVTYKGEAKFLSKDDATHSAVIEAKGKESRGSGTAGATVTTTLVGEGARTKVRVVTDLNVTGRPAQFGRGVMSEVAAKLIDQFAKCLEDEIKTAPAPAGGAPAEQQAADVPAAAKKTAAATATAAKKTATSKATPATAKKAAASKPATSAKKASPPAAVTADAPPAASAPVPQETSTVAAAQAEEPAVRPVAPAPRPPAEPIDLFDVAGGSIAKRLAPVLVAVLILLFILRRRRRS